jgi:hypothetical protein
VHGNDDVQTRPLPAADQHLLVIERLQVAVARPRCGRAVARRGVAQAGPVTLLGPAVPLGPEGPPGPDVPVDAGEPPVAAGPVGADVPLDPELDPDVALV